MTHEYDVGDIVGISPMSMILPRYVKKKWTVDDISGDYAVLRTLDGRYCTITDTCFIRREEITVSVKSHTVLLRSGPGEEFDVSGYLMKKDRVRLDAVFEGWGKLAGSDCWLPLKGTRRIRI